MTDSKSIDYQQFTDLFCYHDLGLGKVFFPKIKQVK